MTVAALKKLIHDLDDNLIVCTISEYGAVEAKSVALDAQKYIPQPQNGTDTDAWGRTNKEQKLVVIC